MLGVIRGGAEENPPVQTKRGIGILARDILPMGCLFLQKGDVSFDFLDGLVDRAVFHANPPRAKMIALKSTARVGFWFIKCTAENAAINGSIFALPLACFVMVKLLARCSCRALLTHQFISPDPEWVISPSANFTSSV